MSEPSDRLGRAAALQAAGTVLSRLTGLGRILAFAYALGGGRLADTFLLANNTPNILYELVLGGVLTGTLVPAFRQELRRPNDAGWRSVSAVVTLGAAASAALAVVFLALAPLIIRLYTLSAPDDVGADQVVLATRLLRLFAPQVFLYGIVSLSSALLRAHRRFTASKVAPALNNIVVIGLFVAYPGVVGTRDLVQVAADNRAVLLLGLGTTAGVAAMAAGQLPLRLAAGHLRWVWAPRDPAVTRILRLSGWTVGFVAANQVALLVVYALANGAAGGVTSYLLAFTIFQLPHAVVAVSVIDTLQPELADAWGTGDTAAFRDAVGLGLRTITAVLLPAAAGLVLCARPLAVALLDRGAFGAADAADVARTLAMMAIGLVPFSLWLFFGATFQAMADTRTLFLIYLVENGANVLAAAVFYPVLGVAGLGLAFAVAYLAGAITALGVLWRRNAAPAPSELLGPLTRVAGAAGLMAVVVGVASRSIGSDSGNGAILRSGVAALAGVTVYLAAARLFGVGEVHARTFLGRSRQS